ncbi:MAG: hypothetical protein ACRCU2_26915 [Planktothrix sp.]
MGSFKMQCPHCGKAGKQGIEPGTNDLDLYYPVLVKTLIGQKLLLRERTRRCENRVCGKIFETVEIAKTNFDLIIKELQVWNNRAQYFKAKYELEKQKTNNLEEEVASWKKSSIDWEDKYKKLENYVKAAPVDHHFSCQEDETFVENEEKEDENLWW